MPSVQIDFEKVHVKSLDLLQGEHFHVIVFLGPKNTKLPVDLVLAMQRFGERAEYVLLEACGAIYAKMSGSKVTYAQPSA